MWISILGLILRLKPCSKLALDIGKYHGGASNVLFTTKLSSTSGVADNVYLDQEVKPVRQTRHRHIQRPVLALTVNWLQDASK